MWEGSQFFFDSLRHCRWHAGSRVLKERVVDAVDDLFFIHQFEFVVFVLFHIAQGDDVVDLFNEVCQRTENLCRV